MYIDSSRIADLQQIKEWMNDYSYSADRRKMFFKAYQKVQAQLHDKKLGMMRERLVKATKASDKPEMWKIMNQIKDYLKEEKLEEGTT